MNNGGWESKLQKMTKNDTNINTINYNNNKFIMMNNNNNQYQANNNNNNK